MTTRFAHIRGTRQALATLVAALALSVSTFGQTHITPPKNKYSPQQDVELGQQAAREAERQLPLLDDSLAASYVSRLGERLVEVIPREYQHPEFRYTFKVVNVREINAFALPGGPMYVNRGMLEAASSEGEVVGVMAHEMSHVMLRHGTAQATQAQKYQIGAIAGAIIGAVVGGNAGTVISEGSRFGLGTAFLRFSREYERQADILGSQLMASAGYDPRDLAHMFETISKQGGGGGPQWLSDHPNPGNRTAYITEEAARLHITNPIRDSRNFVQVKDRLRSMPKAPTTEDAMRNGGGRQPTRTSGSVGNGRISTNVEPPSGRYTTYNEGNLFRVSVPSNWREVASNVTVKFVPDGAYGTVQGQDVFTHGTEIGLTRNETHSLKQATDEFVDSLAQGNPSLQSAGSYRSTTLAGRQALSTVLDNRSEATGQPETVVVYTTLLRDGNLFYVIGVSPANEFRSYQGVFDRVARSIQLTD